MMIHVSQFDSITWSEWQKTPRKCIHSEKNMPGMKAGHYVVGTYDKKIVLITQLTGVCSPRDLLDIETYSGTSAKYNKYEFPISRYWILPEPISFEAVAELCGVSVKDPVANNLFKSVPFRAEAFYNGGSTLVLDRYHGLIAQLIVGLTPVKI